METSAIELSGTVMEPNGNSQRFSPEAHRDYLQLLARLWLPRHLQRRMDASDLVQVAQIKASEKAKQFRGENTTQYKAWLRQILRNTVLDALKNQGRVPEESVRLFNESSSRLENLLAGDEPSPSTRAVLQEDLDRMADLLAGMPDEQQQVLVMKHCLGWKVAEIANELGRTKASVAGLLRRGLQHLREKLAGG